MEDTARHAQAARVPGLLADGAHDPVPVPGRSTEVAARYRNSTAATHRTAGHQLPITHPTWCVNLAADRSGHDRDAARVATRPQDEIGA